MSVDVYEKYWFTVAEAAQYLNISTKTVRNWIKHGYLEAHVLGPRLVMISLDAISNAYRPFGKSYSRVA